MDRNTVAHDGELYEVVRYVQGTKAEVYAGLEAGEQAVITNWSESLKHWKVIRKLPETPVKAPANPDPYADGRVPGDEESASLRAELQKAKDARDLFAAEFVGLNSLIHEAMVSGNVAELQRLKSRKAAMRYEIHTAEILVAKCELAVAYLERALVRQEREAARVRADELGYAGGYPEGKEAGMKAHLDYESVRGAVGNASVVIGNAEQRLSRLIAETV